MADGQRIRKKLDGVAMPGARPTVIRAASMTRFVGWSTPATMAAAPSAGSANATNAPPK